MSVTAWKSQSLSALQPHLLPGAGFRHARRHDELPRDPDGSRRQTRRPPGEPDAYRTLVLSTRHYPSAAQVADPTIPSTVSPFEDWNDRTADSVIGPNCPSTLTLKPHALRRCCR